MTSLSAVFPNELSAIIRAVQVKVLIAAVTQELELFLKLLVLIFTKCQNYGKLRVRVASHNLDEGWCLS